MGFRARLLKQLASENPPDKEAYQRQLNELLNKENSNG